MKPTPNTFAVPASAWTRNSELAHSELAEARTTNASGAVHRGQRATLFALVPAVVVGLAMISLAACNPKSSTSSAALVDPHLQTNGTIEVTARLIEIPEGAIFQRELYDYATVLKYEVIKVHRGEVKGEAIQENKTAHTFIYVAHYNPFKPRSLAADNRVKQIGGNIKEFRAGQVHRMALEVPVDDFYMGGIVNKYFDATKANLPIYWAVWTDAAGP